MFYSKFDYFHFKKQNYETKSFFFFYYETNIIFDLL